VSLPRLRILAAALALSIGASGCATSSYDTAHQTAKEKREGILVGHEVADNNNDGAYVEGGGMTYQLEISRVLNPWGAEDSQYFKGLPKGQPIYRIKPDQLWYGVFLWAKNQTKQIRSTADTFEIVDSEGTVYHPTTLNPSINPYAWTSQALSQNQIEPAAGTTAANGSAGGGLILFELNDSVYENRPLTLEIFQHGDPKPAKVSLDL
jgi:hypothetical protein